MEPDFPVILSDCPFVLNVIFMSLNETLVRFILYFWTAVLFCLWGGDTNVYRTQYLLEQPIFWRLLELLHVTAHTELVKE
jgi:hypothetical protein